MKRQILKYKKLWRVLLLLEIAAITLLSLLGDPPLPKLDFRFADKLEHVAAYLVLAATACIVFHRPGARFKIGCLVLLGSVFFGGMLEVLQQFTGRFMDIWDLAADSLGALLGTLGLLLWLPKKPESD